MVLTQTFLDCTLAAAHVGGDFVLRYNEVECLRTGINPFDVWSGRMSHPPFLGLHEAAVPGLSKRVHAYPPWEYTFFLPLSFVPMPFASRFFYVIQVLSLALVVVALYRRGRNLNGRVLDGLFVVACGMFLGASVQSAFWLQNYGVTNLVLLLVMFAALDRQLQIPAGICWAFLMTKPQVGLLLAIPLVLGRQWKAIGTAVAVCCLASIPPAILCHVSPVDMILCLVSSGGRVLSGTSILPKPVFSVLAKTINPSLPGAMSAAIGVTLCIWLSRRFREVPSWSVRMLPAIVCATGWTYLQLHDKTLFLFPQAVLGICSLTEKSPRRRLAFLILVLLSATSLGAYIHVRSSGWLHDFFWHLPDGIPSQAAYGLYLIGSVFQFIGMATFLFWLSRYPTRMARVFSCGS